MPPVALPFPRLFLLSGKVRRWGVGVPSHLSAPIVQLNSAGTFPLFSSSFFPAPWRKVIEKFDTSSTFNFFMFYDEALYILA